MQKRPLIISLVLLLLLIGGAAFYLHLQKDRRPSFTEVDHFLRNEAAGGSDWRFQETVSQFSYHYAKVDWLSRLGIRKRVYQQALYRFRAANNGTVIAISGENGQVWEIMYSRTQPPDQYQTLRQNISRKFPRIQDVIVFKHR